MNFVRSTRATRARVCLYFPPAAGIFLIHFMGCQASVSPSGGSVPSGTGGTAAGSTSGSSGGSGVSTGGSTNPGSGTGGTKAGNGGATVASSGGVMGTTAGGNTPSGGATLTGGTGAGAGGSTATGGRSGASPDAAIGVDGGATDGSGSSDAADPFAVAAVCTSKTMWTGGTSESPLMEPGMACVDCHKTMGRGPVYKIGGTVYPTAHEPDNCNGLNGTTGVRIVITGADGKVQTLTPNAAGNFFSETAVTLPYQAKVTYMGRERSMVLSQTSGDCNLCHTQTGATVAPAPMAPGRIIVP